MLLGQLMKGKILEPDAGMNQGRLMAAHEQWAIVEGGYRLAPSA